MIRWPQLTRATSLHPPTGIGDGGHTMRARALPVVTPRVLRPHWHLKIGGDLGWRC